MVRGKVKQGERALAAISREVKEEIGLDIKESSFEFVHAVNRRGTENSFIALVFKVEISAMSTPFNNEPDKHNALPFFKVNEIPENIIPGHKQATECINRGIFYSEHC